MKKECTEVEVLEIPCCDLCFMPRSARYDCKTKSGYWGYLCEEHFKSDGRGLGLGIGQKMVLKVS